MSKGSKRRKSQVSQEVIAENWERCFGKPSPYIEGPKTFLFDQACRACGEVNVYAGDVYVEPNSTWKRARCEKCGAWINLKYPK